jgi:hypothetical protein
MQLTRHTVGRWLAGKAHPKLAQFLRLLDVISGRAHDWVAGLVAIESVPTLLPTFRQAQAARNIAFEQPWTEVILRALETTAYREQPELVHTTLAACLGISQAELDSALSGLVDAGILQSSEGGYQVLRELSVDTRVSSDAFGKLQQHWLKVALDRSRRTGTADWFAYNVISLSKADLATVHECLRRAYRETRSIVAASQPCETAALLLMQLVRFT